MPAAVQCSWSYGQLVHGQSVTLGTDPSCGLGLVWVAFPKGDALALLRMVMLLRDLHYDHLDRLEGHRTASLQRHGCYATCQIITETAPSVHGAELVVQSLRSHSQGSCHLYLGATPSVQATVHQRGTFLIHLCTMLQCYYLTAWLGAVALTVLFGELSCHTSQVLQGCEKLSASITATAAKWPSMAPY